MAQCPTVTTQRRCAAAEQVNSGAQ